MDRDKFKVFVTVGTDQPFDRMVRVVDQWAGGENRKDVFAQIGQTNWRPKHIEYSQFLSPSEFTEKLRSSNIVIGHAGMGTILTALKYQKPLLVVPKRASLGEHRNEHQLATAKRLLELGRINVAFDEAELRQKLANLQSVSSKNKLGEYATKGLTDSISTFIFS